MNSRADNSGIILILVHIRSDIISFSIFQQLQEVFINAVICSSFTEHDAHILNDDENTFQNLYGIKANSMYCLHWPCRYICCDIRLTKNNRTNNILDNQGQVVLGVHCPYNMRIPSITCIKSPYSTLSHTIGVSVLNVILADLPTLFWMIGEKKSLLRGHQT